MFRFSRTYGALTGILFLTEVAIALFVHDAIIRPYVGDVLVVILVYCFVRCFTTMPVVTAAILSLLFAFLVETLQYFRIVEVLGLSHSRLANIIIGNSFAWMDMLAYVIGTAILLITEYSVNRRRQPSKTHRA